MSQRKGKSGRLNEKRIDFMASRAQASFPLKSWQQRCGGYCETTTLGAEKSERSYRYAPVSPGKQLTKPS